ncbi:polysaccharide pyruvyl transferase family protein, partial [Mediterraneibacter gnavus]|uniref:polysaccharide pyruvyl transferase family protein n=1 Tax=Mediterraneibacter gnavus TaxID=33038 RepID=UPI0034A464B9
FNAIGLRENQMIPYVASHVDVPVQRVIDPTLLLTSNEYDKIADERLENEKYLLLYSRRYNPHMEAYAEKLAAENGWKIVEISLRAKNAEKTNRRMFYEAGVEEFLSLTKYAECVVTNSFHGAIFAVQYSKPLGVFSREQSDTKIKELLALFGLTDHLLVSGAEDKGNLNDINYEVVHSRIAEARKKSLEFLHMELTSCF